MTITDAALIYIEKMIRQKSAFGFRLSIKKTGCSGYAYVPELVMQAQAEDVLLDIKHNINILIDGKFLPLLQEVKIDYVEEEKSGLKQKRLVFTNPKEASRCGCGESFNLAENQR